ncbi:hypothetical protein H310_01447 [Aphanomyces invadans]|uniref:Myosin motor domain-containing protein n=1 Tax=Aphanomyces invadans TaxID=157072 RepID=A0A024URR5_9STRA|nr:hypothetical protein H310_01447 [Aphanomyces invadans]ETW08969.1 hypothetical protein H310_01447 [Aphanomyces invadans]|eukprot:XP_008862774.1 hypothetical protein H310_01447 [Aphanomyces invadans]
MDGDLVMDSIYRVNDLYWKKDNEASDDWVLVKLTSVNVAESVGTCALIDERTGSRMPNQTESVQLHTMTLCPANPLFTTCPDMTSLRYLHEAALLKNLYDRWISTDRQPYTSMSNVLIAVNPLRYLKRLEKAMFATQSLDKSPPHPYNVAENAYRQLRTVKQNQSIIISGESGSGKTETSKIILDFLTERSKFTGGSAGVPLPRSNQDDEDEHPERGGMEHSLGERLMKTIPILESFGNAKTHRNHNSSRFGKYMRLQFSPDADLTSNALHLTGASIDTYLLETSRVVHPPAGERNFHVFYELLRSGDAKLLHDLKLIPNPYMSKDADRLTNCDAWLEQYHYLNRSGCTSSPFVNDCVNFQNLKDALAFADINAVELFRIVAGVLHLGNLRFDEEDTAEGLTALIHREDAPEAAIDVIADLLGIKVADLIDALLKKKIERTKGSFQRRGSVYFVGKTKQQASYSRDTVAKMIFEQVFTALMFQCAEILEYNVALREELPYIGVLDIFGFEDFEPKNQNSFEQLLINYANEALQSMFNQCILKAEQELYQAENIWAPQNAHNDSTKAAVSYDDNRECLTLIADRREGILSLLNMAGRLAGQSDRKFNEKLHTAFKKHPCFVVPHPRDVPHMFCIKHYAGVVRYHVEGFIEKNNNVASPQFKELIAGSTLHLLNLSASYAPSRTPPGSVSEMFAHQMKGLVVELDSTRNNFIRCIKPNPAMDVNVFDRQSVLEQLRCSGTIQACQVLQVGLPTRVSYEELVFIYSDFLGQSFMERFRDNDRFFTQALCNVLDFPTDAFRLGDTRLFFKTGKIHLLDSVLAVTPPLPPATLKERLVSYLAKSRWVSAATKVVVLRAYENLYWNCRQGRCAIVLQCWFRQQLAKMHVAKMRTLNRVSRMWNVVVYKLQVRAAFDRSVEDKLELLNVLLQHKTLPPHAKWLLTWLGPLQRAMYVRKLGRAACVAYLAKRAFSSLLEKVQRQRAAVKLQSQFRRVMATKHFQKMVERHRACMRWARIRMTTKVNICFLAMYRRAHVMGLERSVSHLMVDNDRLTKANAQMTEKIASVELMAVSWAAKEAALAQTVEALELKAQTDALNLSAKDAQVDEMARNLQSLQQQLDHAISDRTVQASLIQRLETTNEALAASSKELEQKCEELDQMFALSKEHNATLVLESNQRVDAFVSEVDALQNKMNDAQHDICLKTAQISELEVYNAKLTDENDALMTQFEALELLHEREIAMQMCQVTELTADLNALRLVLAATHEQLESQSMYATELEGIQWGMSNKLQEQEVDVAALHASVVDLEASRLNAEGKAAELNNTLATLRLELDEATRSHLAQSNQLTILEAMNNEYKEECFQLKENMRRMESVLADSKEKELALALEAQKSASDAQIAVLEAQLHNVQAQLAQTAAEVKRHNKSAETFEQFKTQTNIDNSTLREKVVTLTTCLEESKAREVAMDETLTNCETEIRALTNQRQVDQLRLGEVTRELQMARQALKEKSATVEELEDVREQLVQAHATLADELHMIKQSQLVSKQVEAELDSQLTERSQQVVELGSELQQMQLRLDQVQERIAVKEVVVLAEETMKMQLKKDNAVLAQRVAESKKAIHDVHLSELDLSSQLSSKNIEILSLKSQLEISQSEVKTNAKQVETLQQKLAVRYTRRLPQFPLPHFAHN